MSPISRERGQAWMRYALFAAAAYNLVWGAFIILFPNQPFDWLGLGRPTYPCLVQCIGMIVGVYGIGYATAALDPLRHWPVVLVGLVGKLAGPIGFVWSVSKGELPWLAGLTIVTNDLVWWMPFVLILAAVFNRSIARRTSGLV
jgi:small multidrug resistance pump